MNGRHIIWKAAWLLAALCLFLPPLYSESAETALSEKGWHGATRERLERVIEEGAGQGKIVVFDFDNTLVCRDIGEATFATLARDGVLTKDTVPASLLPVFAPEPGGPKVDPAKLSDLTEYYEEFLSATAHSEHEKAPYVVGYAWVVRVMAGMSPSRIIEATSEAYGAGRAEADMASSENETPRKTVIDVTPGKTSYRVPFFYPEMAELAGRFTQNGYDVWVVSASNVWTVRWMVVEVLNKKLDEMGAPGIPPDHVIGVSTLLRKKSDDSLHKDRNLVRENKDYARLDPIELARYELTDMADFPVPGYWGKVARIYEATGKEPYFIAGDSPNDHPMLSRAEHKLWIARLEKDKYQKLTAELIKTGGPESWLVQPTLYKDSPGFVPDAAALKKRLGDKAGPAVENIGVLKSAGALPGF